MVGPRVFLSHAGVDTDAARELKRRMLDSPEAQAAGLSVWFDKDDLQPGSSWQQQIARAITQESTAFVVYTGSRGIVNWVDNEVELAISRATSSSSYLLIPVLAPEANANLLPPFARRFQGVRDPIGDPGEFAKLMRSVLGLTAQDAPRLIRHPFVGLRPMAEADAPVFFGRESETAEVLARLGRRNLVAIVAESGSGKSSLALAGVAMAFRGGALSRRTQAESDSEVWHLVAMRPASDPVEGLRRAITEAAERLGLEASAREALRRRVSLDNRSETRYAIRCDLPESTTRTLLVVDQFEELLTQAPQALRGPFIDLITWLANESGSRIHVLLTLRSDYYNLSTHYPGLAELLARDSGDAVFRLRQMSKAGLSEAIEQPLKLAGHSDPGERDALVQLFCRDLMDRPGDLALVQMALYSLWNERSAHGGDLLQAYAALGGLAGALATMAEQVRTQTLDPDESALLWPLMVRLIRLGDAAGATRRLADLDELDPPRRALAGKLATDRCSRLLVVGDSTVEISHEALITQWPWLQNRLNESANAGALRTLDALMGACADWARAPSERQRDHLASGAALASFQELAVAHTDWLSKTEREFVELSGRARRRLARVMQGGVAALILLSVAASVSAWQAQRASQAAADGERRAKEALEGLQKEQERVRRAERSLETLLATSVGTTTRELDTRRDQIRNVEAPFGRQAADALRRLTGADIALVSSGLIRGGKVYSPGQQITFQDLLTEFPFRNRIVRFEVAGASIQNGLEAIFRNPDRPTGGFPQVSGFTATVHASRPAGSRVEITSIDGRPFSAQRRYRVAMMDFNYKGGDGYAPFAVGSTDYLVYSTDVFAIGAALTAPDTAGSEAPRLTMRR